MNIVNHGKKKMKQLTKNVNHLLTKKIVVHVEKNLETIMMTMIIIILIIIITIIIIITEINVELEIIVIIQVNTEAQHIVYVM